MTITRILVVGIEPTYTATLTFDGVDVITASPGLPFKDALREIYPQTEGHPSQNTAFLLPGDDPRILTVANKIASKGHPVVLCVTGYDAPETDLPVVHVKRLHQSIIETLGVRPVPATTVVDDMLTDYDDQPEPSANANPEVFVVDYQDDEEPIHLAAPPTPPADTQPDVPVGIAPPPPTNPLITQTPWGSPSQPAPAQPAPQPATPTAPPWQPQQAPPPPAQPAPQPAWQPVTPPPAAEPATPTTPPWQPQQAPPPPAQPAPQPAWQPTPVAAHHGPNVAATGPTIHQTTAPAYKETATIYAFAVPKGGTGKCVAASTTIYDPVTGLPRTIEDIYKDPTVTSVLSFDGRFITPMPIAEKHDTGVLPLLKVSFASGRSVETTPWHPFLLSDGWRRADEIRVGETCAVPAKASFPAEPVEMDQAELDLLAVLLAEGNLTRSSTRFSTGDHTILRLVQDAATTMGIEVKYNGRYDYSLVGGTPLRDIPSGLCQDGCGQSTRLAPQTNNALGWTQGEPLDYVLGHNRPDTTLRRLRRRHGLHGVSSRTKKVPDAIFRLGETQLARFLAVFWMCDGSINKRQGHPDLTVASQPLAQGIQHLLLRFGIQARLVSKKASYVTRDGSRRQFDAWRVTVYAQSMETFMNRIPIWGDKADRLRDHVERQRLSGGNWNVGGPTATEAVYEELVSCRRGRGAREAANSLGWSTSMPTVSPSMVLFPGTTTQSGQKRLSLRGLRAYCEAYGLEHDYGWMYDSELFWDEVVSVEDAGTGQCYDLTVEPTHCFVAQDILVHNTGLSLMFANTLAEGLRRGLPEGAPGPRVVWIDGNPQQADGRYNIGVEPARTIMDLAATSFDESSIESYLTPPDPSVGRHLWVLAGPTSKLKADPSVVTPALYRRITETLAKRFDHVVVDTPEARLYDPQMAEYAVPITDWLIVPVTPDRGILDGTREWLDLIKAPKYARGYAFDMNRVRIILNMARKDIGYGSDEIAVEMSRWAFAGEVPYSVEWAKAKNLYCLPFNDPDLQRSLRAIIFAMTNAPIFRDDPKKKGFLAGIGLRRKSA